MFSYVTAYLKERPDLALRSPKNRATRFSTKPSYFLGLYDDNSIKIASGIITIYVYRYNINTIN